MTDSTLLLRLLTDPAVFGLFIGGPSWAAWRAFVAAVFGVQPIEPETDELVRCHTGRSLVPTQAAREVWCVVGRRGGKSRVAAVLAVLLAAFRDVTPSLTIGERATLMVIAADRKQARVVFRYIAALFDAVPMLTALVEHRTADAIHLTNLVSIEVHTCSFRSVRGYTLVGCIADEVAFWSSDEAGANPDSEVLNSLRPALATIPGSLLIAISSPYARRGELWKAYQSHFGQDDDPALVWQASSLDMNPTLDGAIVDQAYADDPAVAAAEYGAEFRRDLEAFVSREDLEAAIVPGRHELLPAPGVRYVAFVDPSGGSVDSMTLGIGHAERGKVVVDLLRERMAPFDPNVVTQEFADVLRRYRVRTIRGDRYGGEWPVERFRAYGITYRTSELTKSDLYGALLPLMNSGRVELLNHARLKTQLLGLERRVSRSGKDSIDHAPRARDDVANVVAGLSHYASRVDAPAVAFVTVADLERARAEPLSETSTRLRAQKSEQRQREIEACLTARAQRLKDGTQETWYPS